MTRARNRRINPEKSNKLIWAVGAGLLVLFVGLLLLLTWERPAQNRRQLIERTLAYLQGAQGLIAVAIDLDPNQVTIVYDSHFEPRFARIAHAAARRLASQLPDFELRLARNRRERVVQTIRVAHGELVAVLAAPASAR